MRARGNAPQNDRHERLRLIVTAGALLGMLSSLAGGPVRAGAHLVRHVADVVASVFLCSASPLPTPYISKYGPGFVVGIPAGIFDISLGLPGHFQHRNIVRFHRGLRPAVIVLRQETRDRPAGFAFRGVPLAE